MEKMNKTESKYLKMMTDLHDNCDMEYSSIGLRGLGFGSSVLKILKDNNFLLARNRGKFVFFYWNKDKKPNIHSAKRVVNEAKKMNRKITETIPQEGPNSRTIERKEKVIQIANRPKYTTVTLKVGKVTIEIRTDE